MQPGGLQTGLATPIPAGFPHGLPATQVPVQAPYESLVLNVEEARNYYTATAQLPGVRKEGEVPPASLVVLHRTFAS